MTTAPSKQPDHDPAQPSTTGTRVLSVRWWVAAITFVGGLLLGVLMSALLIATTPDFGSAAAKSGASPAPASGRPTGAATVPVTAEARVNAACLRVINEAQDVSRILSGVDEAASDVDLQRMDDIVRRLQPVDTRLQRDLRDCRVDTEVRADTGRSPASPIPTVPQPTPTATR